MLTFRSLAASLALILLTAVGSPAGAGTPPRSAPDLAQAVERRAARTDFVQLEAFGTQALSMRDREGLNRLYHVTWIILNQGEFERAKVWNDRLAAAARSQRDQRYITIARLNELTSRYDQGDSAAAVEMERLAGTETDWFTRAHATRLWALALMDQDRIGDGLKLLTDAEASMPEDAPYADTARAGLWEMAGIGLMKLNDIDGAAAAFGRFEIDFANPVYPRPDFDSLYNLTRLAVQVGDQPLAEQLFAAHHRLSVRADLESLTVYDDNLCAMVAEAAQDPRRVLRCLAPYGVDLGAAAFLAPHLLPTRAVAYAQTGQVAAARRDLARIRSLEAADDFREEGASELAHVEAEVLFAEGRSAEAYARLRQYVRADTVASNQRFSAGIRQVTGDMQEQLEQRRRQLETASANTRLQSDVISSQRWVTGIAVIFFLSAIATMAWQFRQGRQLRVARRRAEDASRSKSEFLANMSHEIRTPLNGVVAMADTLSRAPLQPREHEMVAIIQSSGITLERLLSDILDSAKIEAGQVTIEPTVFHLGDAVREIAALWRPGADEKAVTLEAGIDPALDGMVSGDAVRVRQILTNLVSNSLKFTAAGSVRLRVEPGAPDAVRFTVTDTGVGFDDEQKEHIFGRFHQADGSITRRYGGTGLGLAISRDLAELMGGTMSCDSTPGEGSTFWFEIPLPRAEAVEAHDPVAAVEAAEGSLRILLADDHPANRKVIEVMLSETEAELVTVVNGEEAVAAFARGGFDLVLMDMQMPVMDGLTATAEIRALEAQRGLVRTPVLMLTANALAEHVEAGRQAGADGHLSKPITMATLFAGISSALDSAGRQEALREVA